jgi:hypothetical protein
VDIFRKTSLLTTEIQTYETNDNRLLKSDKNPLIVSSPMRGARGHDLTGEINTHLGETFWNVRNKYRLNKTAFPTFGSKHPNLGSRHPNLGSKHPNSGSKHPTF